MKEVCPFCGKSDSLSAKDDPRFYVDGRLTAICFKGNDHPAFGAVKFFVDTGELLNQKPVQPFEVLYKACEPGSARGHGLNFLADHCGIYQLTRKALETVTVPFPTLADLQKAEDQGGIVMAAPLYDGPDMVGLELRALEATKQKVTTRTWTLGKAGIYIANPKVQPKVVIVFEGVWDVVAASWDAFNHDSLDYAFVSIKANTSVDLVRRTLSTHFPGIPVLIITDQDGAGKKPRAKLNLVGTVAILDGCGLAKDYREANPKARWDSLLTGIERALDRPPAPILPTPAEAMEAGRPPVRGFEWRPKGLFFMKPTTERDDFGNAKPPVPIYTAPPFHLPGLASDEHSYGWCLLIAWKDPDGIPHEEVLPFELLSGEGAELARTLAQGGMVLPPDPACRRYIVRYLSGAADLIKARVRMVRTTGWHNGAFVLPSGETIGHGTELVRFTGEVMGIHGRSTRGTLEGWQTEVARYAVGNSRLENAELVTSDLEAEGLQLHSINSITVIELGGGIPAQEEVEQWPAPIEVASSWEVEEESATPVGDEACLESAEAIQSRIHWHQVIDVDSDWAEIEVNLPVVRKGRLRYSGMDEDLLLGISGVLEHGSETGSVPKFWLDEIAEKYSTENQAEDLRSRLESLLGELGIQVEDGVSHLGAALVDGEPSDLSSEVIEFLDDIGSSTSEPLDFYYRTLATMPLLTKEDEQSYGQLWQDSHDPRGIQGLVEGNLRFVVKEARKYRGFGLELEDLISEGNVGLITAAMRFDPTRENRFLTYAAWWIRQSIFHALSENGQMIRTPQKVWDILGHLERSIQALDFKLGRQATQAEIAESTSMELKTVDRLQQLRLMQTMIPINEMLADLGVAEVEGGYACQIETGEDEFECLYEQAFLDQLFVSLGILNEKERNIISLHFGLLDDAPLTLEQIGQQSNPPVSRERVRQIEERAFMKIRERRRVLLGGFLKRTGGIARGPSMNACGHAFDRLEWDDESE